MFKQSIKKRRYSFSLVFVLSFASLTSLAQETLNDLTQEIQIAAKHNSANLRSKVATYKENVVITQGNIKITADEATVYSDLKTDKKTYVLNGKPVKFERIEEEVSSILAGFGEGGTGHVFNLGHGIHPDVNPDHAGHFIECVHRISKQYHK